MADNNSSVKSSISPQKPLFNISNSAKIRKDAFIFSNGDRYEGEYVVTDEGQLVRHGHGKHINADEQLIYDGSWYCDKMQGNGRLTYGNGSSYDGEFRENFFEGLGTYTWADGGQYTGIWQRSKPIGKAEYTGPKLGVPFVGIADGNQARMRYKVSSL